MKKSELRQLIREEISKILKENSNNEKITLNKNEWADVEKLKDVFKKIKGGVMSFSDLEKHVLKAWPTATVSINKNYQNELIIDSGYGWEIEVGVTNIDKSKITFPTTYVGYIH